MRALKFAASALLMAAAAFGQQTTPYINPWANAGAPGQGAVSISAPSVGGGSVLSGNQVTFTTQQSSGGASYPPSYAPSSGPYNPGSAVPGNADPYGSQYGAQNPYDPKNSYDPKNQYGNQYDPKNNYGNQYDPKNQYGNPYDPKNQYGNPYDPKNQYDPKYPLMDVSPYFPGDCSSYPCLNGGTCYDSSQYAKLSGNTVAAPGQFDTANAGDAESQLSAALAGQQVPNLYSKPAYSMQYQKMSWCKCYGPYYGKYCEKRQCDPKQNCSSDPMDQLLVVYPKNVQIECGSYMGANAAGAGAAIAADVCRQAVFTTSDRYESGPQNCPESMMIRRTFTGTDRCGKTSQGLQSIAVVDTKPPKVRAKLVPFPPLAVSASQITLTPEQVKAIVKVLLAVAIEGKKKQMMAADPKLAMLGDNMLMDKSLFLFDGLNLNMGDVNSFLGSLVGKDLSGHNMTSIFGDDTASMLMANGFDQQSVMAMLNADPTLSGANSILGMGSGSVASGSMDSVSSMLGSMFGSGVGNSVASQIASQRGTPATVVNVPNDDNNGDFKDWLMSRIALPVGAQVCSEPTTRVFAVNCTAADKCTPGKRLKAAARLKVTYIVGRRTIGVPDQLNDPMFLADPLKAMLGKDKDMKDLKNMKMGMDQNMMDMHQQMLRDDLSKKLGIDFNKVADQQQRGSGTVFNNIMPLAAGPATVVDSSVTPAAMSSGGDAVDLSTLMGNRVMDYDAMLQEGGYTTSGSGAPYDPKANQYGNQYGKNPYGNNPYDPKNQYGNQYDPKNNYGNQYDPKNPNPYDPKNQYGNNPYDPKNQYDPKNNYGNQYDPKNQYGNPYDPKNQYDPKNSYDPKNQYDNQSGGQYGNQYDPKKRDRVNQGTDPNQAAAFLGSNDFREQNRGTKVFAFQCKTAVAYVPVHCGDVVSITLDPEDACLAEQFDPMNHTMMMNHQFMMDDFQGDVQKDMRQKGFSDQGFVGRTSFNAIAVRGTAVELEVLAEDECYNVGKGVDNPARDCETFVSGKCCAPVTNGLSQFAINQVLHSQGADQPHFMGSPTMQLSDINFKLP